MIKRMVERANSDEFLKQRGRFINLSFALVSGDEDWLVTVDGGRVSAKALSGASQAPAFTLRAARPVWEDFAKPVPPPGTHDILALFEGEQLQIDGDALILFRNLLYVKLLLEKARQSEVTA
jgi:hypothetical protein